MYGAVEPVKAEDEEGPTRRRRVAWRAAVSLVAASSCALSSKRLFFAEQQPQKQQQQLLAEEEDASTTPPPFRRRLRKIYYINCDGALDRRLIQEKQLGALGVEYERFPCVDSATADAYLRSDPRFADKPRRVPLASTHPDATLQARTVGVWLSHYVLFDAIANREDDDLYLVLEDDAVWTGSVADVEEAARTLPADWAYASLNVHESVCEEDRVNDFWYLKTAPLDSSLYDGERVRHHECTLRQLDDQWGQPNILYLSAAAQLLRPDTASQVTRWLDSRPLYHVDALLRTPNASAFPAYQHATNLFTTASFVSESRRESAPTSTQFHAPPMR